MLKNKILILNNPKEKKTGVIRLVSTGFETDGTVTLNFPIAKPLTMIMQADCLKSFTINSITTKVHFMCKEYDEVHCLIFDGNQELFAVSSSNDYDMLARMKMLYFDKNKSQNSDKISQQSNSAKYDFSTSKKEKDIYIDKGANEKFMSDAYNQNGNYDHTDLGGNYENFEKGYKYDSTVFETKQNKIQNEGTSYSYDCAKLPTNQDDNEPQYQYQPCNSKNENKNYYFDANNFSGSPYSNPQTYNEDSMKNNKKYENPYKTQSVENCNSTTVETSKDCEPTMVLDEGIQYSGDNFFLAVKPQLDEMFECYPLEEKLTEKINNSKWIRVDADEDFYVVGIINDENELPEFICYGIPGSYTAKPPQEIADVCDWFPIENEYESNGYWLIYQSAQTGKCLRNLN